jgi:hypothetical protein
MTAKASILKRPDEKYVYELLGAADEAYPRLNARHPRNRGIDWRQLGRYLRGDSETSIPEPGLFVSADREFDALHIPMSGWLLSERARDLVESLVAADVTLRPLGVNGARFWGMQVINTLTDALDTVRSDIAYDVSGSVKRIDKPVWRASQIRDPAVFRIPQRPYDVWATESVEQTYQTSACTGITFWRRGPALGG